MDYFTCTEKMIGAGMLISHKYLVLALVPRLHRRLISSMTPRTGHLPVELPQELLPVHVIVARVHLLVVAVAEARGRAGQAQAQGAVGGAEVPQEVRSSSICFVDSCV